MSNQHELDSEYFDHQLRLIVNDIDNYTPLGMFRVLTKLADVARPTETHSEFMIRTYGHPPPQGQ
jgi:hypothetical protein